jgi:hypothetical protein
LSSTTDSERPRGQILVVFAGGLVLICMIAALVFDVGQNLLDRRSEQNAADAAALAGARYVVGAAYTYHAGCAAPHSGLAAVEAACEVAAANGYIDGQDNRTVRVDLPPVAPSTKAGLPEHIEVSIGTTRGSFFMGVVGITQQRTGAMGVATNASDIALPYSLLALNPHACGANKITGSPGTAVTTSGAIHIDSDCATTPGALQLAGNGVLTSPECDVVGLITESGGATNACTTAPAGVLISGDPLRSLPPPPQPGTPATVLPLDATPGPIPANCPGGSAPATDAAPGTCAFSAGGMAGKTYRLFPGNYPGGISTSKATLYLDPGIYWIGGSGIHIQSGGAVISKAPGDDSGTAPSGGVLIYNTSDPVPATGCTGAGCYDGITINGGGSGPEPTLALEPIETGDYKNMVIFVDRTAALGGALDIDLNGENSVLNISGTIYAPTASLRFNGSDTDVLSAQVICYDFVVNGSGSAFTIDYDPGNLFHVTGVGLVE